MHHLILTNGVLRICGFTERVRLCVDVRGCVNPFRLIGMLTACYRHACQTCK